MFSVWTIRIGTSILLLCTFRFTFPLLLRYSLQALYKVFDSTIHFILRVLQFWLQELYVWRFVVTIVFKEYIYCVMYSNFNSSVHIYFVFIQFCVCSNHLALVLLALCLEQAVAYFSLYVLERTRVSKYLIKQKTRCSGETRDEQRLQKCLHF